MKLIEWVKREIEKPTNPKTLKLLERVYTVFVGLAIGNGILDIIIWYFFTFDIPSYVYGIYNIIIGFIGLGYYIVVKQALIEKKQPKLITDQDGFTRKDEAVKFGIEKYGVMRNNKWKFMILENEDGKYIVVGR